MKPPFAYAGGKSTQADRIVSLFPDHDHYIEPFAGSLAVLLAKPPSAMETVNDLDEHVMTFWRVLRDRMPELVHLASLTPHSRSEHLAAYDLDVADELERARRIWVLLTQSRSNHMRKTGWRFFNDPTGSSSSLPGYLAGYTARMPAAAGRLKAVSLECRPALEVIADYGRPARNLLYVDPPYLRSARNSSMYRIEMGDEASHRELAEALRACTAAVVLSGYPSPLYDELYSDWHCTTYRAWTGNGLRDGRDVVAGERVECLWSNRELAPPAPELPFASILQEA